MKDFIATKGVVLRSEEDVYYRVFDYIHPFSGFISYPLKKSVNGKFVNLEEDLLSGKLEIGYYPAGMIKLPFLENTKIKEVFEPRTALSKGIMTRETEKVVNTLVKYFEIPFEEIGYDGSNVYNGADKNSDLDLLVFGKKNTRILLDNLEEIAKISGMERYSKDPSRLSLRRKNHLGVLSKKDLEYEIKKPVFFKGDKHINITPTFRTYDSFMDFNSAFWEYQGIVMAPVRILDISKSLQVPALYSVESLDKTTPIDTIETNMFYHAIKGAPGDIAFVSGPYVRANIGEKVSNRVILSSWGKYKDFKFSFK